MVKAIEEQLAVDVHPGEKGWDFLILVEDETCVDNGLLQEEADGLVVGDTIVTRCMKVPEARTNKKKPLRAIAHRGFSHEKRRLPTLPLTQYHRRGRA